MKDRLMDAEIAIKLYGWEWVQRDGDKKMLMPPMDSKEFGYTGIWDGDGLPQYLPRFTRDLSPIIDALEKLGEYELRHLPNRAYVATVDGYAAVGQTIPEAGSRAILKMYGKQVEE